MTTGINSIKVNLEVQLASCKVHESQLNAGNQELYTTHLQIHNIALCVLLMSILAESLPLVEECDFMRNFIYLKQDIMWNWILSLPLSFPKFRSSENLRVQP